MRRFRSFFKFELKNFLIKRNLWLFGVILAITLVYVQLGVNGYNKELKNKAIFQDVELKKAQQHFNYRVYGLYGLRYIFLPHSMSILALNSSTIQDMVAFIDSGERLQIYKPLQGKAVFEAAKSLFTDFSGIIFFIAALFSLAYGFEGLFYRFYLRGLSSYVGKKGTFAFILLSRSILLFLLFLFISVCAFLLIRLNGIPIPLDKYTILFVLLLYGQALFFLCLGSVFGSWKRKIAGAVVALSVWFVFLFVLPGILELITENKADVMTPIYKYENEKLKIVTDFEKRALAEMGVFELSEIPEDKRKEYIKSYRANEFEKLQKMEDEMIAQLRENIGFYHKLTMWFPSTFFLSNSNELSSKGFLSLLDFYEKIKIIKRAFFETYMLKVYFSNYAPVEPFLKGDENVHPSHPFISRYFIWGLLITAGWILLTLIVSLQGYLKSLYRLEKKEMPEIKEEEVNVEEHEFHLWKVEDHRFGTQMYGLLSGEAREFKKKGYDYSVQLNQTEISGGSPGTEFLYLSHLSNMPGNTKVKSYLTLLMDMENFSDEKREHVLSSHGVNEFRSKPFRMLTIHEQGRLLLTILDMKRHKVYLLDDISSGLSVDFALKLLDRMRLYSREGSLVLFLARDLYVTDAKPGVYFSSTGRWIKIVESYRTKPTNSWEADG